MAITTQGAATIVTMARYLPSTTRVMPTGRVQSRWSVFCRRSSAMTRMVRMGMAMRKMMVMA